MTRSWFLVVLVGPCACVVTPVPDPPPLAPPDLDLLTGGPGTGSTDVFVDGAPGAAEPGAIVWCVNLDRTDPPVETPVGTGGSFAINVMGMVGDELRLQVRLGSDRSAPLDVIVPPIGVPTLPVRPLADCLILPSELALGAATVGADATGSIALQNDCGADVTVTDLPLRVATLVFAVETVAPLVVPSGGTALVDVRFTPSATGLAEEVLFVNVGAPSTERRAVTLYGAGL